MGGADFFFEAIPAVHHRDLPGKVNEVLYQEIPQQFSDGPQQSVATCDPSREHQLLLAGLLINLDH